MSRRGKCGEVTNLQKENGFDSYGGERKHY